jgi:hypothetical protein
MKAGTFMRICCATMVLLCSRAPAQDTGRVPDPNQGTNAVDASVHADVADRASQPARSAPPSRKPSAPYTRWGFASVLRSPATRFGPEQTLRAPPPSQKIDQRSPLAAAPSQSDLQTAETVAQPAHGIGAATTPTTNDAYRKLIGQPDIFARLQGFTTEPFDIQHGATSLTARFLGRQFGPTKTSLFSNSFSKPQVSSDHNARTARRRPLRSQKSPDLLHPAISPDSSLPQRE